MKTEEQLIDEIRQLFHELIEEEKERYIPGTNYRFTLPPDNYRYYKTAEKLSLAAHELCKINHKYSSHELDETIRNEVSDIERFEYKFDSGSKEPTAKSKNELIGLMRNATTHIRISFYDVLGDIEI